MERCGERGCSAPAVAVDEYGDPWCERHGKHGKHLTRVVEFIYQSMVITNESIVIERVAGRDALGVERWNEIADLSVERGLFDTIVRVAIIGGVRS